jgi:hypothetical protein
MANRSHKVIFDANDRFISEADVRITTASVSNAHKVILNIADRVSNIMTKKLSFEKAILAVSL